MRPAARAGLAGWAGLAGLAGLVLVAAGCSGGSTGDGSDAAAAGAPTASPRAALAPGELPTLEGQAVCDVRVTVTGALEVAWTGRGQGTTSKAGGPAAFYQSVRGRTSLSVYAAGNGFRPNFLLSADGVAWSSSNGAAGLEVADDGTGATLDTDATRTGAGTGAGTSTDTGDTVHVTATIDC